MYVYSYKHKKAEGCALSPIKTHQVHILLVYKDHSHVISRYTRTNKVFGIS